MPMLITFGVAGFVGFMALLCGWANGDFDRDSDGTATAAACEDMPVPQDCQARAEGIAQTPSPNSQSGATNDKA